MEVKDETYTRAMLMKWEGDRDLNSQEFVCKCGKQKGWITEGKETLPCPSCGRKYIGVYNGEDLCIDAIETTEGRG